MASSKKHPKQRERELLLAARHGDRFAFGQLYRLYLTDERDFCARRIADATRAEDLAQDTFVRAFERISEFRPDASFWPWISTIARHLCIDEFRQRRRTAEEPTAEPPEPVHLHSSEDVTSEETVSRQESEVIRQTLGAALGRLSHRERSLIWQSAVQERSWEQIARTSGTTVHGARNAAWRARSALRAIIGDSLRDFRTWIAVVLSRVAAGWRDLRRRGRDSVNARFDAAGWVLVESSAAVVMGIAALSMPLLFGTEDRVAEKPAVHARETTATPPKPNLKAEQRSSAGRVNALVASGRVIVPAPVLKATMHSSSRQRSAAPHSTGVRIDVYGPTGQRVYWRETEIDCADEGRTEVLPSSGPVRFVC